MTNYFFTVFLLFGKILLSIRKEFKMQISKMSPAVSFKGCLQYRNIINDMTQKYEQEIRNINLFNTQDENQKIINFASVKLREYLSKNYPNKLKKQEKIYNQITKKIQTKAITYMKNLETLEIYPVNKISEMILNTVIKRDNISTKMDDIVKLAQKKGKFSSKDKGIYKKLHNKFNQQEDLRIDLLEFLKKQKINNAKKAEEMGLKKEYEFFF